MTVGYSVVGGCNYTEGRDRGGRGEEKYIRSWTLNNRSTFSVGGGERVARSQGEGSSREAVGEGGWVLTRNVRETHAGEVNRQNLRVAERSD